jgi:hypothetical protein
MIYLVSAHNAIGTKSRAFGWFSTDREADEAVANDIGGLREALYDWVVIESQPSGIHATARVVRWYRWGDGWYRSRTAPEWAKGMCNLGGVG